MLRRFNRGLALMVALIGCVLTGSPAMAGWGHHGWGHRHHHHHHHGWGTGLGFGGLYSSWGYPSYGSSYTSLSIGFPRYYSGYSSYYGLGGYGLGGYSLGGYGSFYTPRVVSYSLPSYYVAPQAYYYAPSYSSYAPAYQSYPGVCDPCASYPACGSTSITVPSTTAAPALNAPVISPDGYSTGIVPPPSVSSSRLAAVRTTSPSVTSGGSFVDRMLGHSGTIHQSRVAQSTTVRSANSARVVNNQLPARTHIASPVQSNVHRVSNVQRVSTNKAIANPDTSLPAFAAQLTSMPAGLLEAADAIFAAGGYAQAASAYARLTVQYGNHDELAVRRFVALVASGDCAQAAVVFQLAEASGQALSNGALPAGGLAVLYKAHADVRKSHVDFLADYAMKHADDELPLTMVGTWLVLDGQPERAELFLKRDIGPAPKSNLLVAKPEIAARLVAVELAR